jgi:hypothetical protein
MLDLNALKRKVLKAPKLVEHNIFLWLEKVEIFAIQAHNKII